MSISQHYDKRSNDAIAATMFGAESFCRERHTARVLSSADLLNAIRELRAAGATTNAEMGRLLELPSSRIAEVFDGKRKITVDEAKVIVEKFGLGAGAPSPQIDPEPIDMVGIQHIDMAYGLGATFAVDRPEIEVMQFPRAWIESITHSPPAMLTWTKGKGDSMEPTIRDGDMVLLDRSQRTLTERDAMWAFTIGEEAAIKRLRRQGDRCQILSDNQSVPVDEQNLRDMNIVGRVVFVGSRK